MPTDYGEVLKDLDASIVALEAEVATLRAGRPTIVLLRNRYSSPISTSVPPKHDGRFAHMGPTEGIRTLLSEESILLTTGEIADKLTAAGLRSKGQDFTGNVSATLSRLRDAGVVEKVGDGWRMKPKYFGVSPDDEVVVSPPADTSHAATAIYPSAANV